jgi:hypothetical protein
MSSSHFVNTALKLVAQDCSFPHAMTSQMTSMKSRKQKGGKCDRKRKKEGLNLNYQDKIYTMLTVSFPVICRQLVPSVSTNWKVRRPHGVHGSVFRIFLYFF